MLSSRHRVLSACALLLVPGVRAAEPLPADPRVQTGVLPNGLTWVFRPHPNPPGQVGLLLQVRAGALHEPEGQVGVARFVQHMVFAGTENFPPGAARDFFEGAGLKPGSDFNASTGLDQTQFSIFLPAEPPEQLEKAVQLLSDFAFRVTFPESQLDAERETILGELREGQGVDERIRDEFLARLFPGSMLAKHRPVGELGYVQQARRAELLAFYRTWYRPERMTLIVMGDTSWDKLAPRVEKWFGSYRPEQPASPEPRLEIKPPAEPVAIVITDPEYAGGEYAVTCVSPPRPPARTTEDKRGELAEQLAGWVLQRRLAEQMTRGATGLHNPAVRVANLVQAVRLATASGFGEPPDWASVLGVLATEVARARQFGFTPGELELAGSKLISALDAAARTEPDRPVQTLIFGLAAAVHDGAPLLSRGQELDVVKRLLPELRPADLQGALAASFPAAQSAYVLQLPADPARPPPPAPAVLAAVSEVLGRPLEPRREVERPKDFLPAEPTPGRIVESTTDEELGLTSAWLANGARVHHRAMRQQPDTVMLSIALAGGQIEETPENAGITEAAVLAWQHPATARLSSLDINDLMGGRSLRLEADAGPDVVVVRISGAPADLEPGLRLLHALLTEPKLEENTFQQWQRSAVSQLTDLQHDPNFRAGARLRELLSGGDLRQQFPTPERIGRQTAAAAEAWLRRLCREAPLEAALVGDLPLPQATALLEKYIGGLPQRPRTAEHLAALRAAPRAPGPYRARLEVPTDSEQAMALLGFVASDAANVPDTRALQLAADILERRLAARLRQDRELAAMVRVGCDPGVAYADSGVFLAGGIGAPPRVDDLVRVIGDALTSFSESGPTPPELDGARRQTVSNQETAQNTIAYWSVLLQTLNLRGTNLAAEKSFRADLAAITPEQVRDVFRKYDQPARRFRVVAVPVPPEAETQPAEPPPAEPRR